MVILKSNFVSVFMGRTLEDPFTVLTLHGCSSCSWREEDAATSCHLICSQPNLLCSFLMKTRVNWGNPEETEDLVFNQGKKFPYNFSNYWNGQGIISNILWCQSKFLLFSIKRYCYNIQILPLNKINLSSHSFGLMYFLFDWAKRCTKY